MSIQMDKAREIRANWGNKVCDRKHRKSELEKEYVMGSHTGDYVCPKCGEAFSEQELENKEN